MLGLVEESGYRDQKSALTVEAVRACLSGRPDLVDAWFGYSEDKRTSSGWYIVQCEDAQFEVGFFPKGERLTIESRALACAEFILREVRAIAG